MDATSASSSNSRECEAPRILGVQPDVMRVLDSGETGAGGEIQLTDAMAQLIGKQAFHATTVDAVRHDCGDKAGYVIANVALALEREDIGPAIREYIGRA